MKKVLFYILVLGFVSCGGNADKAADATAAVPTAKQTTKANPAVQRPKVEKPKLQPKTSIRSKQAEPKDLNKPYTAKNEGWMVDLEKAYAESKKSGKPILANFTGSDWCGWCKRLDKSVFHQPGFDKWAKDNVVLLELDFPRRFKLPTEIATQNRSLQQSFGVRGYPTIWLFDAEKDSGGQFSFTGLGKTGYTKTIEEFQKTIGGFMSQRG